MALTSIKHYVLDANKINIPDEGLGKFLSGFTEENEPFNWITTLWNLLPITGQIFFVAYVLDHWWTKSHPQRILVYQNGFIKQCMDSKGRVKKKSVINFHEINELLYVRTHQYKSIYGITKYEGTSVNLSILDSNNVKGNILTGMYHNKHEIEGKYNFIGYACNAIHNSWIQFAMNKCINEISSKGYVTFTTPSGEVLVGRNFIKANNIVAGLGSQFSYYEGYLYLYPNATEGAHSEQKSEPITINVAEMCNKEVFMKLLAKFMK